MGKIKVPGYGIVDLLRRFKSYNRDVFLFKPNGRLMIAKVLREKEKGVLTLEEILVRVKNYIEKLREHGVPVISETSYVIEEDSLWEFYPAFEFDLETLMAKADSAEFAQLLLNGLLLRIIKPLFQTQPGLTLEVGLDIAARNYVTDGGTETFYSDYLPAKAKVDNLFPLEYPEPTHPEVITIGRFRHYDKGGLLLTLVTQTLKFRPELREIFFSTLHAFLKKEGMEELSDFLGSGPTARLKRGKESLVENEKIIMALTGNGADYLWLRDTANTIAFWAETMGCGDRARLKDIFDLTHLQDEPVPVQNIETARRELIRWNLELFS